ncbi:unnamed protein product, partial [Discosporangium mesarthrocarpum]
MHEFKLKVLLELAHVFRSAGRSFGKSVYAAGIGNRPTDAHAYRGAGIPPDFIFIINPMSDLQ